jgi:hypothetical protein
MCCGCATESYPCRGSLCLLRDVEQIFCDLCGDVILHDIDGQDICEFCLMDKEDMEE